MTSNRPVLLYDTTLRDGMQREGLSVSVEEKLRIAVRIAELGIHFIEGGFPASNPKDEEFFRRLERENLGETVVAAFGMTRARGMRPDQDRQLRVLADCWAPVATVVGKTWDLHIQKVLRVDAEENLRMIAESVAFLVRQGKRVFYDAEHFFDAFSAHPSYALACLRAAVEAGAEAVCLCDTNGAALPSQVGQAVEAVVAEFASHCRVGIHAHNDTGCAVANSVVAVERGADVVQGTINGYGERCGNADLCVVIPNLELKMGIRCVGERSLAKLTDTARYVAELCNVAPDPHQPYVGHNAFAHKGGMHVAAMERDPRTFQHIDPALVGNTPHILVSELSGRATIKQRLRELGYSLEDEKQVAERVLRRLKEREHLGYHYEAADASFELLLRAELGQKVEFFHFEAFRIIVEKREDGATVSEATIKVHVNGERFVETAEGNGPVNALDKALRQAIERRFPELRDIHLINYSVRILDENQGTAAKTRVLIESTDGRDTWGSVGVGVNVVEASWEALVDSITYGLLRRREESAKGSTKHSPSEEQSASSASAGYAPASSSDASGQA